MAFQNNRRGSALIANRRTLVLRASVVPVSTPIQGSLSVVAFPPPMKVYSRYLPNNDPSKSHVWEQLEVIFKLKDLLKFNGEKAPFYLEAGTSFQRVVEYSDRLQPNPTPYNIRQPLRGEFDMDVLRKYFSMFPPEAVPNKIAILIRKGGSRSKSEYYGLLLA